MQKIKSLFSRIRIGRRTQLPGAYYDWADY